MSKINSICLFCGSSAGVDPIYRDIAARFGALVAGRGARLVFGGGRVGLMGVAADAALAAGGEVVGVIPEHLQRRELGHNGLNKLHIVDTMHTRKNLMFELSDAVAVLPGGIGTMDEAFEVITWRHLGLHDKPILFVDETGYWAPFRALIDGIIEGGFGKDGIRRLYTTISAVEDLFDVLEKMPKPSLPDDIDRL